MPRSISSIVQVVDGTGIRCGPLSNVTGRPSWPPEASLARKTLFKYKLHQDRELFDRA